MACSWRRLALPVTLSLAGHALIVFLVGLLPVEPTLPIGIAAPADQPLRLTLNMAGPSRRVLKPTPPKRDWLDVDIVPIMQAMPTTGATLNDNSQVPKLGHADGSSGQTTPGSGDEASPGVGVAGGSEVVVVPPGVERVVFLIDRSLSMGLSDALDRAKVELAARLRALPSRTLFQVFAFNQAAWPMIPSSSGLLRADRDNVAHVLHQLDALAATGVTRHAEAIRTGLRLQPDLLIVLTDADDLSPTDVQLVTRANQGRSIIDIVELTRDPHPPGDSSLSRLAALNRGQHRRVVLGR